MKFKVIGENGKELSENNVRYIMFKVVKTYGENNLTILEEVWRGN